MNNDDEDLLKGAVERTAWTLKLGRFGTKEWPWNANRNFLLKGVFAQTNIHDDRVIEMVIDALLDRMAKIMRDFDFDYPIKVEPANDQHYESVPGFGSF